MAFVIEKGHYGDVDLSGTKFAQVYQWPGAVHEGNGTKQTIVDESATPEQHAALEKIMTGDDTSMNHHTPGLNIWLWISAFPIRKVAYASVCRKATSFQGPAQCGHINARPSPFGSMMYSKMRLCFPVKTETDVAFNLSAWTLTSQSDATKIRWRGKAPIIFNQKELFSLPEANFTA